jgi:nitroreductase
VDVYEAVASRRAVRGFTDKPVPRDVLERVLIAAARTPSGGNLQPWNSYVLTGVSLAEVKKHTAERVAAGDPGDEREFEIYPPDLKSPYCERRFAAGQQRYAALGISRDDTQARERAIAANWDCFGASAAVFCYIDRDMMSAQWADIGMYLQTIMLLLRAEGLHSCPQKAWSVYHATVAEVVSPPDELMLFCGMSIGYEDRAADHVRIDRAPLAETVTFLD